MTGVGMRMFEVPPEMTPGFSRIELKSNREAVVENCGGVLEYSDEAVRVKTGKTAVRFTGRNLKIRSLTADALVVEGFLTGIEFLQ